MDYHHPLYFGANSVILGVVVSRVVKEKGRDFQVRKRSTMIISYGTVRKDCNIIFN